MIAVHFAEIHRIHINPVLIPKLLNRAHYKANIRGLGSSFLFSYI